MAQVTFGLGYAYSPDVQYYSFVFWCILSLRFQMPFSKFPFWRSSYILWLQNSGLCAENLFSECFFTWSKAMWSPHLRKKKNYSYFKRMGSIIGKEQRDEGSWHYHLSKPLQSAGTTLSLLPSRRYHLLKTKIFQFNMDMELYTEVFGVNINCGGNGFSAISFICSSLTLLRRFFVISSLSPAAFRYILFFSFAKCVIFQPSTPIHYTFNYCVPSEIWGCGVLCYSYMWCSHLCETSLGSLRFEYTRNSSEKCPQKYLWSLWLEYTCINTVKY